MATFDGSSFGAIDSDAVDPDEPLDAWIEHALANNEKERWQNRGDHIGWSPVGGRGFSSPRFSIIHYIPGVTISPSVEAVDAAIGAEAVKADGSDDFNAPVDLRVRLFDGRRTYFEQQTSHTSSNAGRIESIRLQGTLDRTPSSEIQVPMFVEVRGGTTTVELGPSKGGDFVPDSQFYMSDLGAANVGQPNAVVLPVDEVTAGGFGVAEGAYPVLQDAKAVSDPDSSDPDDGLVAAVTFGELSKTDRQKHHNDFTFSLVNIVESSYIRLYSFDYELTYRDDLPLQVSPPSNARGPLAAQQKYDAANASYQHAQASKRTLQRDRPLCIGYDGDIRDTTDNWPSQTPEMWGYARGDQTTETIVDEQSLSHQERGDWEWEVRLAYSAFDLSQKTVTARQNQNFFDALRNASTTSEWDLEAEIAQYQVGDTPGAPTVVDAKTVTLDASHVPADNSGRIPLPTTIWYLFNGHTIDGGYPDDLAYIPQEGQLHPGPDGKSGDLGLVNTLTIRVPNDGSYNGFPLVLNLDATAYTDDGVDPADAVFVMLGLSVWGVPP